MDLNRASRYLSYLLRHHPEAAGITLDAHGWADVTSLLAGMKKYQITRAQLEKIVASDAKQRYAFDATGTKIRANQGHSVAVDVELRESEPPALLWHGSACRFAASIAALPYDVYNTEEARNYVSGVSKRRAKYLKE